MSNASFVYALHVLSAMIWVGGMFFAWMVLRPAAANTLTGPVRLVLWAGRISALLPMGVASGSVTAHQWRGSARVAVYRLCRRTKICASNDGAIYRHAGALFTRADAANAAVRPGHQH
jgi:putative copper export protein